MDKKVPIRIFFLFLFGFFSITAFHPSYDQLTEAEEKIFKEQQKTRQLEDINRQLELEISQLEHENEMLRNEIKMIVTATAYNSLPNQTDDTPFLAAWHDILKPGMKIIAVSRDLEAQGLTRGTKVYIEGYGEYIVLDRMHKRKTNQIDLYMGLDKTAALEFGRRKIEISWLNGG